MADQNTMTTCIFNTKEHVHLTPYLAGLHAQCITSDKLIGPFLPPLSQDKLLGFWKDCIAEATAGTRVIVLLVARDEVSGAKIIGDQLYGVVMLALSCLETGPYRASVESLLVSTKHRRRHGAVLLLQALEKQALAKGRTLLMAEMECGTPAEMVFRRLSYQEAGSVPAYGIKPGMDQMKDFVFVYKNLAAREQLPRSLIP